MNHQSFQFSWTTIFFFFFFFEKTWCFDNITWKSAPSNVNEESCSTLLMLVEKSKSCVPFVCRGVWNQAGKSHNNIHLIRAYSRPILRPIITTPFCKNYAKLYFDAKNLEKRLNMEGFFDLFFKKCPFFHENGLILANIKGFLKFVEYALLMYFVNGIRFDQKIFNSNY